MIGEAPLARLVPTCREAVDDFDAVDQGPAVVVALLPPVGFGPSHRAVRVHFGVPFPSAPVGLPLHHPEKGLLEHLCVSR